jgi:trehalose/maltose hydrolase-like predicted phosphorylase
MLKKPMKNEFKVVLLIFIFSGTAFSFQVNAEDQSSRESSWLAIQETHQENPNSTKQQNPNTPASNSEVSEKSVSFDFVEENKLKNEREDILITPNQKLTIKNTPTSNTSTKNQEKVESENQSSILSFNLMLNLLYRFKTGD